MTRTALPQPVWHNLEGYTIMKLIFAVLFLAAITGEAIA